MGIFDKMVDTVAKKIIIDTAVNATVRVISEVTDYKSKSDYSDSRIIRVPNSSIHYLGMNCKDVHEELTAYGFTNITLLPKKKLIKGWFTKDGAVSEVSIKGKTEFKEKSKFLVDAHVVIKYQTFRDSK